MRRAFRLVKAQHASEAFLGEGARLYGGRWNKRGTALVYTSESLALAALEQFVHLGPEDASFAFVFYSIDIPDEVSIEEIGREALPSDWREEPPPDSTKTLGSEWAQAMRTAVLCVPSIVVPSEHNHLLNPTHPEFPRIRISKPEPFASDPQMWKR